MILRINGGEVLLNLQQLVIGEAHLKGCDLEHINSLVAGEKSDLRPIEVRRTGDIYTIINGRHRFIAGIIKGDTQFNCMERND